MATKRINISLPTATIERLKIAIPEGKRSQFIAETLDDKLGRKLSLKEEIIKGLRKNRHIYEEARKDWSVLDFEGWPEYKENED
ncbi:hypothetical protein A2994_01555 [candidate division Kazan bacterium RIFCSPLOWO2_01_FULL_48_13]|uniref:CopG family transcriptional regulator n=1 Tax=candidate division Kazan bacterium RIFCSPLOWO2_01_FULL_48_13 TaxID=1798539 RepID=A0A1F4PMV8_UNCK3|nr:MAG: hypothetical protein A2994_01555 [candidate division Kazan bacterium RIFCSPLOWO2_01_FULL_48_13]